MPGAVGRYESDAYVAFPATGFDEVKTGEPAAGEKLFVDFPGQTIPIHDPRSGERVLEAELFVAVLGASSYLHAEALPSQELMHWVAAHVHAFEALGGCPAIVVCDNLRSGVTRPYRYEPDVNATYSEMAAHYGVSSTNYPRPCTPANVRWSTPPSPPPSNGPLTAFSPTPAARC